MLRFGMIEKMEDWNIEHFPEPFLVRFIHPHHRSLAVTRHDFLFGEHKIQVRPWRLEDHAEQVDLLHHVRLCIESVPLYAWNPLVVQQIIGRSCSLDYIEANCKDKSFTKALCVWAWAKSPALVPRVSWVTLPGPAGAPGMLERGRCGLQRRAIIQLGIVEDMSGPADAPPPFPEKHAWGYGLVDGERLPRDRTERIPDGSERRDHGHRDDDDSGDRDGRGPRDSLGWCDSIRRTIEDARSSEDEAPAGSVARGRSLQRSASLHSSRRRSWAARTPPTTLDPPSSPNAVCPSSPSSKGSYPPLLLLAERGVLSPTHISLTPFSADSVSNVARRALDFLAPSSSSASRPPGFEGSPALGTPPLLVDGSIDRTMDAASPTDAGEPLEPLFHAAPQPLLPTPDSPPPPRVAARRKTLAGVSMVRSVSYSLQRTGGRPKSKLPVAKATEAFLCQVLGIVQDGQEVTERAMQELERRFEGQIADDVLASLRELFKVSSQDDEQVDAALLRHGGFAGLNQAEGDVDVSNDV
jgi:hypothetical protein